MDTVTERSSARVNLPQSPSEIFPFVEEQGCTRYWGEELIIFLFGGLFFDLVDYNSFEFG